MKKRFIVLLLALCTSVTSAFSQGSDNQKLLPYPIHQKKLANGLNVVTVPYNSPGLASFYIVVRAGSREEVEKGKTGFAHFFEHMMFRGTDKYPKEKYGEVLKSIGAAANANTWLDRTLYHMTGNASMLDKMFEIEADRFQNLKYSVHDFKTEAGAVKGEYTKNSASPYTRLNEKVVSTAFKKHTYAHTTMGFFEDVVDMPNQYDYSLKFFDRFYRPEYATVMVVGDVTPERVNELAQKYFGNWKRGSYKPAIPTEPEQKETRYAHVQQPNFPPYLSLNFKGPAFSDTNKELAAIDILTTMLFAENSDLYQKLVVQEQRARSIGGYAFNTRDPHLITLYASVVKPEDLQYVKDEIMKKIDEIKQQPVDQQKLENTKSYLKYSFAMAMDSPDNIANALSSYIWITGDPESLNRSLSLYDQVTAQDLTNIAKKYFVNSKLTIGTISPNAEGGVK
ncbi:MAG: insulinase family protein [Hymenobacteraceae bacterium]|nr:insulinase family protein [Hymenobacteraceae bacterium]MDX5394807.1 insulinase family protein [Hymenobacteraceae bacterium]MDX5443230.1 insulinase family protein [Hymenobacteraceae bacterium]MDX5510839.1 insulinase family protein [Hymenobacteraceae bacterium]